MIKTIDRVKTAIDSKFIHYQFKRHQLERPRAHFPLFVDTSRFQIKIAESMDELRQVLRLRYEVFFKEQLQKTLPMRIDFDSYDLLCDHLLIIDKRKHEVVGTYRLISSKISNSFYSENEFDLSKFMKEPDHRLELGRACVHKDYRNGMVMTLLWRGLSEYMQISGSRYLFGCSSVKTMDPVLSALIIRYLQQRGSLENTFEITPTKKYVFEEMQSALQLIGGAVASFESEFESKILPPLLKGYLRAGAKVHGLPAIDRAFKCIDLLTIFDRKSANEVYAEKFKLGMAPL